MWILLVVAIIWFLIPTPVVVTSVEVKVTPPQWPPWQPYYGEENEQQSEQSGYPWA